jgi:hypothetical protein
MNYSRILVLSFSLFVSIPSHSQIFKNILGGATNSLVPANEVMIPNLRADVVELTQAKYNNRALGTTGYKNVTAHLERRMQQLGLIRYGTVGYKSSYKFPVGKIRTVESKFYVEGKSLHIGSEVLPLNFAATADNNAHLIPNVNEAYGPWTLALPNGTLTENNIIAQLKPILLNAQDRGATAVYFYDNSANGYDLKAMDFKGMIPDDEIKIPAWIISKSVWNESFKNTLSVIQVNSQPRYKLQYDEGYNVIGLIDHKAEKTVVLMADYDEIYDEDKGGAGANLNASGVAALLQLAQVLKANEFKQYNYAIAAFSGSSKGSLGAKSFLSIPEMVGKIAYAIDLTAVGRMSPKSEIFVNGLGTSLSFKSAVKASSEGFRPRVGKPYAFTASYLQFIEKSIPVMSLSTGLDQYKKDADLVSTLNFTGIAQTVRFTAQLLVKLNEGTLPLFAKNELQIEDEELIIKPIAAVVPNKPIKEVAPKKSEQLAQAKANLKANKSTQTKSSVKLGTQKARPTSVTKTNAGPKLPVEGIYRGQRNIVVDNLGIGVNELDEREGGALIHSIEANSKAAAAGIASGDIILQIGSMPVFNAKSYLFTLQKFKEGERAYFKVKRKDGKTDMINIEF